MCGRGGGGGLVGVIREGLDRLVFLHKNQYTVAHCTQQNQIFFVQVKNYNTDSLSD